MKEQMNQLIRVYDVPDTVLGIFHILSPVALTTTLQNCYNNSNHFLDEKIDRVMLNKLLKVTAGKLSWLTSLRLSASKHNVKFFLLYKDIMQRQYLK